MTSQMYLWNIGLINIPDEIDKIFSDDGKYLISPTLNGNHYFEMSGESMYYALKDIESNLGVNTKKQRERIVYSIKNRIKLCGGHLYHDALSSGITDTQLRSTSSAIRVLISGLLDGFNVNDELVSLVNYHFKFFFNWNSGMWFCHDTSEWKKLGPKTHLKSTRLSKEKNNTLTLNTHFDSLSTLLLLKCEAPGIIFDFDVDDYINRANKSIQSLLCIDQTHTCLNKYLQKVDCKLLNKYLRKKSIPYRIYERIIHPIIFKLACPTIFFDYGFISRDLAVMNRHLDYMIVNMVDIARYAILAKGGNIDLKETASRLFEKLKKGVDFIEKNKEYQLFLNSQELSIAWLCELSVMLDELNISYNFNIANYSYPKYSLFTINK